MNKITISFFPETDLVWKSDDVWHFIYNFENFHGACDTWNFKQNGIKVKKVEFDSDLPATAFLLLAVQTLDDYISLTQNMAPNGFSCHYSLSIKFWDTLSQILLGTVNRQLPFPAGWRMRNAWQAIKSLCSGFFFFFPLTRKPSCYLWEVRGFQVGVEERRDF